jgi:hypothetical protein
MSCCLANGSLSCAVRVGKRIGSLFADRSGEVLTLTSDNAARTQLEVIAARPRIPGTSSSPRSSDLETFLRVADDPPEGAGDVTSAPFMDDNSRAENLRICAIVR